MNAILTSTTTCSHTPPCPPASAPDREAAQSVASHPEQGWSLLCNGVVLFDDTGELLPAGAAVAPRRPTDPGQGTVELCGCVRAWRPGWGHSVTRTA